MNLTKESWFLGHSSRLRPPHQWHSCWSPLQRGSWPYPLRFDWWDVFFADLGKRFFTTAHNDLLPVKAKGRRYHLLARGTLQSRLWIQAVCAHFGFTLWATQHAYFILQILKPFQLISEDRVALVFSLLSCQERIVFGLLLVEWLDRVGCAQGSVVQLNIKIREQCVKTLWAPEVQAGFRKLARSACSTQCQKRLGLCDDDIVIFVKVLESLRGQWFGEGCHRTLDRWLFSLGWCLGATSESSLWQWEVRLGLCPFFCLNSLKLSSTHLERVCALFDSVLLEFTIFHFWFVLQSGLISRSQLFFEF